MYKSYNITQKKRAVREHRLCYNCLSPTHVASNCVSEYRCRHCRKSNHSSLHEHASKDSEVPKSSSPSKSSARKDVKTEFSQREASVLLPTVEILVKDVTGKNTHLRALLDTGSQATFITEGAVRRRSASCHLKGVGNSVAGQTKGEVDLTIFSSHTEGYETKTSALILPKVSGIQPRTSMNHQKWDHLRELPLADPLYHRPGKIDIIFGADVTMQAFRGKLKKGDLGMPVAHSTVFGWVVAGSVLVGPDRSKGAGV